jgi:hypothetical protein
LHQRGAHHRPTEQVWARGQGSDQPGPCSDLPLSTATRRRLLLHLDVQVRQL